MIKSKHTGFLFILLFPMTVVLFPVQAQVIGYTDDQVWTKLTKGEDVLIIDMRSEDSYLEAHIPTAINIEFTSEYNDTLVQLVYSYGKAENIFYCSCTGGSSAKNFISDLITECYDDLYYMSDNFNDWTFETVSGPDPGSISISNKSLNYIMETNNQYDIPELILTNFLPINLGLLLLAIAIVIYKKKK